MSSSDGCRANKQGCRAATAMIVFESLWCTMEIVAIIIALCKKYNDRQDNEKGRSEVWIRGYQVFSTLPAREWFCFSFVHNSLTSFRRRFSLLGHLPWSHYFHSFPQESLWQTACAQGSMAGCWSAEAVFAVFCVSGISLTYVRAHHLRSLMADMSFSLWWSCLRR